MPIGHGPSLTHDAGHGSRIDELLGTSIICMVFQMVKVGHHHGIGLHVTVGFDSQQPVALIDEVLTP